MSREGKGRVRRGTGMGANEEWVDSEFEGAGERPARTRRRGAWEGIEMRHRSVRVEKTKERRQNIEK